MDDDVHNSRTCVFREKSTECDNNVITKKIVPTDFRITFDDKMRNENITISVQSSEFLVFFPIEIHSSTHFKCIRPSITSSS